MRSMLCNCPFHDAPIIVGYRLDLPSQGKPLRGIHGLVCEPCGRFYGSLYRVPLKYVLTADALRAWMRGQLRIRWADYPLPRLTRIVTSVRVIETAKAQRHVA